MPRYRFTQEPTPSLVGRLLLLIAGGKETSASLSEQLGVTDRTVNRYIEQLNDVGWQIERVGTPTHADYYFELKEPRIVMPTKGKTAGGKQGRRKRANKQGK